MSLWNLIIDRSAADFQRLRELFEAIYATATPTADQLNELQYGPVPQMLDPNDIQFTDPDGNGFTLLGQNQNGSYGAADLNRVATAGNALCALLAALPGELQTYAASQGVAWGNIIDLGYSPPSVTMKTTWAMEDENSTFDVNNSPVVTAMDGYLSQLNALRDCLPAGLPNLPESMANLTLDGANIIERMLFLLAENIEAKRREIMGYIDEVKSGQFYAGEIYSGEV